MEIDVFSDIVCPWCFVGVERLERALATVGKADSVEVRFHPFLLHPDAPPEGLDVPSMLRERYGVNPREAFARVEAAARESGLALDLSRQPRSVPTVRAQTLLRHAGPKGTQRALARELHRAHFVDAEDVSDPEVLVRHGERHGFNRAEVESIVLDPAELEATREKASEAGRMGVRGVPLFLIDRRRAISGAQPESVFVEALKT